MNLARIVQIEPVGHATADGTLQDGLHHGISRDAPAYMHYPLFCQLVDRLPALSDLHLQGSEEPLLHLHFFQMVRYAATRGIRVSTHTGLSILPQYCADECVQSGLHAMHVALDAASHAVYEAIHGKARFDKILRNLRRLTAAKSRFGHHLPHLHLSCTLVQQNLAELPALVQLAHDEGIRHLSMQHLPCQDEASPAHFPLLHSYADQISLQQEDPQRVRFYFDLARNLAKKLKVNLHLPGGQTKQISKNFLHRDNNGLQLRFGHDGRSLPLSAAAGKLAHHTHTRLQTGIADMTPTLSPAPAAPRLRPYSPAASGTEVAPARSDGSAAY